MISETTKKSSNPDKRTSYARVVFPLPLDQEFTYGIPDELLQHIAPGSIVSAPFRNSIKTGFVTALTGKTPGFAVKDIQDTLYDYPVFNQDMLKLARWMSDYYFTSPGNVLQMMLPVKLNRESVELIFPGAEIKNLSSSDKKKLSQLEQKIIEQVKKREKITPKALRQLVGNRHLYYTLDKLNRRGLITIDRIISTKKVKPKTQLFFRPVLTLSAKKQEKIFAGAPVQADMYRYILAHNPAARTRLLQHFPGKDSSAASLLKKGLIEKYEQEVSREYLADTAGTRDTLPPLTAAQQSVVNDIEKKSQKKKFAAFLLHGVTGSGKTRVYLELARFALNRGDGILFLVPEIALTNYFLAMLRVQFGESVAVLHSRMSEGERYDSWRAILSDKKQLVIGPRSAVFAPLKNLKLIIVDEEHDASYKQHESPPYYHARDIAVLRGHLMNACVVLGSATPSMESYYNAQQGKYSLLELPERIDRTPLPAVRLIDLRTETGEHKKKRDAIFSDELYSALEERLKKDEQVLLMQNRRGYSTFIQCCDCGYIETCKHCKITLTYHKKSHKVMCHFCGYSGKAQLVCPECGGSNIRYSGIGTQQIEEALIQYFPGYRTIRMDLDTTRTKSAHLRITAEFERGESDILVGTQMISKGFDFGRVNLVGVVSADTSLLLPEFRADERTFQLLTQAAGRAGRRKEQGVVLIQTYYPNQYSITAAKNQDFRLFYEKESEKRSELNYPPFGRMILLRFSGEDESKVTAAASETGRALRQAGYKQFLLGPAPAPIEKIRNMYRWQIFLKSGKKADPNGRKIRAAAHKAKETFEKLPHKKFVIMSIDVDPINLL
ncbi:hypothetical protein AMJ80_02775 [bacterium SM23_31]|nr:MAG: hypothetical protein AMJ80_02775 [bacterium SM23_31]